MCVGVTAGNALRGKTMEHIDSREAVERLLAIADVRIGGGRLWDIEVYEPRFFSRLLAGGSLALGESWMDGWWNCVALDQFFDHVMTARLDKQAKKLTGIYTAAVLSRLCNRQRKSRAFIVGEHHYDIGNDLFRAMLDRRMAYSCGYWVNTDDLDSAQEAKLDLICRKIGLGSGSKILDIGCGWGSFSKFAAEKYNARVVGITVSVEQVKLACETCAGNPVEIRLQDYRDLDEQFDHIVSVGMFEHVGYRNYRTFMNVAHQCLAPGGTMLLHTIGGERSCHATDPWIDRYIFPNSVLPSAAQITCAAEGLFSLRDWHEFGCDYDRTLMAWHSNFIRNWDSLKERYDQRFYRMWTYYLLSCAGVFRSGRNRLWQIVFTKDGSRRKYVTVR